MICSIPLNHHKLVDVCTEPLKNYFVICSGGKDMKRSVFQQNSVYCFIYNFLNNIKVSHQAVSLLHSLSSDRTSNHAQRPGSDQSEGRSFASNKGLRQNGIRTWGFDIITFFSLKKKKVVSPVLKIWERRNWDVVRNFQDIQHSVGFCQAQVFLCVFNNSVH